MSTKKIRSILIASPLLLLFTTTPLYAAAYVEGTVADGGSISGKLSFEGALPEDAVEKITISKNPEVCDEDGTGYREVVWVDVEDGALRGAFVFIKKISKEKKWAEPVGGNYIVLQKGCRFRPWEQVVKPGPIIIRHSDPDSVLHNINAREMIGVEKGRIVKRTMYNFGQPDPGNTGNSYDDPTLNKHNRKQRFITLSAYPGGAGLF